MKTELKVIEEDEEITIQLINGVVRELKLTREEYEDLQKIKLKPIKEDNFPNFWNLYPAKRRQNKPAALRAWKKINPCKSTVNLMFASLEKFKKSGEWLRNGGQYIPLIATWLNGRRWEDEIIEERTNEKYDPAKAAIERIKSRRDTGRNQPNVSEHFWNQVYEDDRLRRESIGLDEFVERRAEGNDN